MLLLIWIEMKRLSEAGMHGTKGCCVVYTKAYLYLSVIWLRSYRE